MTTAASWTTTQERYTSPRPAQTSVRIQGRQERERECVCGGGGGECVCVCRESCHFLHVSPPPSSLLPHLHVGLTLTQDSKTNSILVKSVKGATRKDGRIRVGDQILAINREWLENVSLTKASKMLKKAASKSEGVSITFLPAPHSLSSSSNSYGAKSVVEKTPSAPSNQQPQQQRQQSQHYTTTTGQPLQQNLTGGPPPLINVPPEQEAAFNVGGQSQGVGMAPSHPNIMAPQMAPPPQMSQWTSYPLAPGTAISPMQPHPYNYSLPQTAQQPFGQHLQQVVWQVGQPGSLQLPVGQPPPQQVAWILREPPHYVDHVVHRQHMMSAAAGAPYPMSGTTAGPVSVPPTLHPPQQPPPSLSSQPHSQPQQSQLPQQQSLVPLQSTAVPSSQSTVTTSIVPHMTKAQSETKTEINGRHQQRGGEEGGARREETQVSERCVPAAPSAPVHRVPSSPATTGSGSGSGGCGGDQDTAATSASGGPLRTQDLSPSSSSFSEIT